MSSVGTFKGRVAALQRREMTPGTTLEFEISQQGGAPRRVQWLTGPGDQLREGDVVTVTGEIDANAIVNAKTVTIESRSAKPRGKLSVLRGILSVLAANMVTAVLAAYSDNEEYFPVSLLVAMLLSAVFMAMLTKERRRANALLGAAMALGLAVVVFILNELTL